MRFYVILDLGLAQKDSAGKTLFDAIITLVGGSLNNINIVMVLRARLIFVA